MNWIENTNPRCWDRIRFGWKRLDRRAVEVKGEMLRRNDTLIVGQMYIIWKREIEYTPNHLWSAILPGVWVKVEAKTSRLWMCVNGRMKGTYLVLVQTWVYCINTPRRGEWDTMFMHTSRDMSRASVGGQFSAGEEQDWIKSSSTYCKQPDKQANQLSAANNTLNWVAN